MSKSLFPHSNKFVHPELISNALPHTQDGWQLEIDNIPEELKVRDQFLLHNNKKQPVDQNGTLLLDWPNKGMPFEEARELLRVELAKPESDRNFHGFGFMPKADGILCVDLDHARDSSGRIKAEIDQLIRDIQSCGGWIEKSLSGNVHIWTRGQWHQNKSKHENIEVFYGTGYVCLTGRPLEGYSNGSIPKDANPLSSLRQRMSRGAQFDNMEDGDNPNSQAGADHQHDAFASLKLPLPDWPLSRVRSDLLPYLDYEIRSSWLEVGHALHHQGGGEIDWLETWSMWSDQSSKFVQGECESIWTKMDREKRSSKSVVTLATLIARAAQTKRSSSTASGTGSNAALRVYSISELMALPPQSWLVKGVIPKTGMGIVYGDSGSGKTFITIDLALSIARGLTWQSCRVKNPTGVLYVSAEGGGAMSSRLKAYAKHHDTDLSALPFGVVTVGLNLRGGDAQKVIDGCNEMRNQGKPIGLVIFDTLNRTMGGGDENSSKDMGEYLDAVAKVAEKTGTFVLVVHHSGKDSKKGARGHSSLRAAVDTELEVKAEGETQILKVTKSRDGLTGNEYAYKREVIVVGTDADLEDVTSCVAISIDSAEIVSRKKKPSGKWQGLAFGALQKLGGVALKTAVLEEVGNIVQHKNRWRDSASRGIQKCIDVGIFVSNGDQLKFS